LFAVFWEFPLSASADILYRTGLFLARNGSLMVQWQKKIVKKAPWRKVLSSAWKYQRNDKCLCRSSPGGDAKMAFSLILTVSQW
jgi:uncharacterized integral membrane protein